MKKQIDAEVDGGTLAKDATIEWGGAGAMGGEPSPEDGEEKPPDGQPAIPPPNGNGQQPPNEEKQLITGEKQFDINKIQRLLNQGAGNGS